MSAWNKPRENEITRGGGGGGGGSIPSVWPFASFKFMGRKRYSVWVLKIRLLPSKERQYTTFKVSSHLFCQYLPIIGWGSVWNEELWVSRRVLSAEADRRPNKDNTLLNLHNSSYHTKAESNDYFIIHSKYFHLSQQSRHNPIHVKHNH